jgi:hypothetical protein
MLFVASGKLACNNIFGLDENFRNKMLIDDEMKQKKKCEVNQWNEQNNKKQKLTFRNAAIKYFDGRTLLVNDIKSLLKNTYRKDNSPMCSKIGELREQLHCQKEWLDFFNLNSTNSNDDASNPNIVQENDLQNEENIQNIFLPNSGIVPENGSVGRYTTVPLSGISGTRVIPAKYHQSGTG